ncbi:DNA-directed RNA polymerase subunit alpha [Bacillus thuringiensis]|uniref:DNA-directed RNA polymerase subunit alpha n=1 Tax=Bacillus thuringiensis TaxID=1428 RepID=UPI0021D65B9C|nr:DNA-directed RNA polymerase subunit alpha [Bacillus thuringiensis]MCU7667053.1 DNA-directed RNA polymerase subunit alpha [Bacillus thuringiensis]
MNLGFKKIEVQYEEISNRRARFHFSTLERGYARTLGNDLRRVLLSSIPGTAVMGLLIEGLNHEFQHVSGTINNGTDLVTRLKNMIFSVPGEEMIQLKFSGKKAGSYYAKDIVLPEGVECLTPDVEFLKLTGDKEVNITIFVKRGRGYLDADEHKEFEEEGFQDVIRIDSDFKPVKNVSIHVEKKRVGQNTNYEKLVLDVETDGVVSPKEAITIAKFILISHLRYLDDMKEFVEEFELLEEEKQKEEEIFDMLIETLDLSPRPYNCLKKSGCNTIGQVLALTREQLKALDQLGAKSIKEIEEKLVKIGYKLKDE